MRHILTTAFFSLCVLVSGCTTMPVQGSKASINLLTNPFDTPKNRPDVLLTAGVQGTLIVQDGCIFLSHNGGMIAPVWPVGSTIAQDPVAVRIIMPNNRGVAVVGQTVRLSGGAISSQDVERQNGRDAQCAGKYFAVSSVED